LAFLRVARGFHSAAVVRDTHLLAARRAEVAANLITAAGVRC
jgi:hypothetical protein